MKPQTETESRPPIWQRLENSAFLIYFAIMLCERLLGGVLGIFMGGKESMLDSSTPIPKLVHPMALIAAAIGIFAMRRQWKPLFRSAAGASCTVDCTELSCGIGFFLFSGMLHTGFSVLPLRFTAYGFLALGLIFHALQPEGKATARQRTLALIYIISFSMTVPVIYDTGIYGVRGGLFVAAEIVASCYLTFAFASMTETFLYKRRCGANPAVLVTMLGLVSAVFFLRLPEYKNWLIAAFAIITLAVWTVILILERKSIRASANPFDFGISRRT